VTSLLSIKLAVKYAQLREIESMRAIALAHQNRNLADFEKALRDYKHGTWFSLCLSYLLPTRHTELSSDPTIRSHLAALYDTLLQQNLLRIVEPYSVVEIDYVAKQVGQGRQDVEAKCALYFLVNEVADVLFQTISDDFGQGVPRCAGSRTGMPNSI
jgi:26S proteasome regulatory subunit N6